MGEPQPLLLKPNGSDYDAFFLPEDTSGTITFNAGDVVTLACTRSNLIIDETVTTLTIASATCVSGTKFSVNGQTASFETIVCSSYPYHTAQYTGRTCEDNFREIEVGFQVETNRFLVLMNICFDDASQNAIYSWYNLTAAIGGYQRGFPRPSFLQGTFYSVGTPNVNTLYTRAQQRITINGLLGLDSANTTYVHATNDYYLARGHLTAKADYVYGSQHRLTFYFVNVAPQWQTFNGGNWERLESSVRSFASDRALDLLVYTGTYGVTTLPHAQTKEEIKLYLYLDENNNNGIAVPQLYWKFVYEPVTKAGVVFVGINNPYQETFEPLCTDISDIYDWLSWKKEDQKAGYSYACEVEEFRKAVDYFPDYEVRSLLQ